MHKKLTRKSIAGLIVTACCIAATSVYVIANDVYKVVDENGKVTFSDNPTGTKIESVDLPHINTAPAVDPQPYTPPATKETSIKHSIRITSPGNKAEILAGQRDLTVTAEAKPPLSDGFSAQLYMNGTAFGGAQPSTSFVITEIMRGEHSINVAILNASGKVVARSRPITVYVRRPGLNRR